jgi:hypothetical protein
MTSSLNSPPNRRLRTQRAGYGSLVLTGAHLGRRRARADQDLPRCPGDGTPAGTGRARIGREALDAGVPRQGRARGRVSWDHGNGHGSHADHGDRLTHRRWPCTRRRQARNRTGTPSAYLIDGLIPPGVRPFPRPDPALACRIAARPAVPHRAGDLAVTPHQTCSASVPPVLSGTVGPPSAYPGSRLADTTEPAAREVAAVARWPSRAHPPAARGAVACLGAP